MSRVDFVIRGGEIMTPSGKFQGTIGIENEKIAFISNGLSSTRQTDDRNRGESRGSGFD